MSVYLEQREAETFRRQFDILASCDIHSPVIFDVGANVGQSIELYCRSLNDYILHCFEPNPEAFDQLQLKFERSPHIKLLNMALTNYCGNVNFYATKRSELSSLLQPEIWLKELSADDKYVSAELLVPCLTLDQYCEDTQIERIDILKIDVQGAEPFVLEGGQRMLREARIAMVYLEIILAESYIGQATLLGLLQLFESHRYRLWDLVPFTYTSSGAAWTANALFVHSDYAKQIEEKSRRSIADEARLKSIND